MSHSLFDLFQIAHNGNTDAQIEIIQKFQPLLHKYVTLLHYEDAYYDLQLYFLEFIHSEKILNLRCKSEATITKYIAASIRHQYIALSKQQNTIERMVSSSTDERDYDTISLSHNDEYLELLNSDLCSILTPSELKLLYQYVFEGKSIAYIASTLGISRQAVNRKKLSILHKLKQYNTAYNI